MNENTSTKPEVINAKLSAKNENDILNFEIITDDSPNGIEVNLDSESGQADFKKVFSALLEKMLITPVKINLTVEDEYSKSLFIEVCKEYIKALNSEIVQVYDAMQTELKINQ